MHLLGDFKNGAKIEVGSGSKTRFLFDRWCSSRPLRFDHPTLFRLARNKEVMVENYWVPVGNGGVWHVDLWRGLNDWEVADIANLLGRLDRIWLRGELDDSLSLTFSKNGVFAAKSCRMTQWNGAEMDGIWTHIWKIHIPSKVVFFLWAAIKERLPTINLLQWRGMIIPNACPLCF